MFDIIADSACDFTPEMAQKMGVEIVPFYVSLDGEHYRKEGKEIAVRDFYQFMVDNPSAYPKTSLASIEDFEEVFRRQAPGELTYQLCEEYVDDIVTVSEDETAAAILSLMENQKLVAEGAGAVPVAAALFHKLPIEGKKVVCLISGGNIDVNILNRVITRGLVMSGRKANLTIALEDKPGQLERVAAIVSRCGSNVVSVLHDGSDPNMPISSCFLKLVLETRDHAQIEQIRQELTKEGFQLVAERV